MSNISICDMSDIDINRELSVISFTLLDMSLDSTYRRYLYDRSQALMLELESRRNIQNEIKFR